MELKTKYEPCYENHYEEHGFERNYWKFEFENGYGASVICHKDGDIFLSYANNEKPFELVVLHNNQLCYDTHITNDVMGWLTSEEVEKYLEEIEKL